ncbi:hypothetical protein C0584_01430 [Candidatus Parcubacteria bacterium]|nr:MAG: hypothetical protein C0584_01430 [Candidatus Parcubacteria bacterium]
MLDYLTKFNALPKYLKDKMSDPSILSAVKAIEEKYDLSLAATIMKVMVKDISILDLSKYFVFEHDLSGDKAEELVTELKNKVLYVAAEHLGLKDVKQKDLIGIEDQEKDNDENRVKSSNFFFSSEDEEEVSSLTQKLGTVGKEKKIDEKKIDSVINDVIFDTGVSFSSSDLSERFIKVLKTYTKGVRKRIDTKLTLAKDVDKGGLGMSGGRVEEVLKLLDKKNKESGSDIFEIKLKEDSLDTKPKIDQLIEKTEKNNHDKEKKSGLENFRKKVDAGALNESRDVAYDLSSMPKKTDTKDKQSSAKEKNVTEIPKKEASSSPKLDEKGFPVVGTPVINSLPNVKENIPEKKDSPEIKKPLKAPIKSVQKEKNLDDHIAGKDGKFKPRIVAPETGKKRVEDVKAVPRLMGPIDELLNMTIIDFRRLDSDPMRAAAKIKEKIDLLGEDGIKKKLEGKAAWRKSKVFKEYIDIGRKAIGQKKPIYEVINDKTFSNQETLKEAEFEAVLNLNREIRF